MYIKKNVDLNNLVSMTEDFISFLERLYKEGTITYEQYEDMTVLKKEFLKTARL